MIISRQNYIGDVSCISSRLQSLVPVGASSIIRGTL